MQLVLVGQVNNKNILNSRTKSNMNMCNSSYEVKAVEQETVIFRKEKNSKINLNIYEFQIEWTPNRPQKVQQLPNHLKYFGIFSMFKANEQYES